MMLLLSFWITTTSIILVGGANRLPPVNVYKCCNIGETLSSDDAKCETGGPTLWAPIVYAPARKVYLPKGTVPLNWKVIEGRRPQCADGAEPELVKAGSTHAFLLFANGSLYLSEDAPQFLHPGSYCADTHAALVCALESTAPPERTHQGPLIKKCCGEKAIYSDDKGTCIRVNGQKNEELLSRINFENSSEVPAITGGFPHCNMDSQKLIVAGKVEDAKLSGNSGIIIGGNKYAADNYCFEIIENGGANIYACVDESRLRQMDLKFVLYPIALLISAAFLAATLAAGFATPSGHHALHWRCQTHYIACLLLGDLLLAITQLAGNDLGAQSHICIAVAILMHFFFLAAFFWLNTMCVNIWWTFRDFRPTSLDARAERMRLKIYYIYAWGGPILISGVAAVLDRMPNHPDYQFLRPRFGEDACWFYNDDSAKLAYFFGPLGVLLAINLILFASTARQLTCGLWKREDVKSNTERAALGRVCLKLVVVMGVTWTLDVISWACGGPDGLWYVTDFANGMQGLFIFLVLGRRGVSACCRRRTQPPASSDSTHVTHHASMKVPLETVC